MDRTAYKYNLEYRATVRIRLASLAKSFIDGRLGVIEAARELGRLGDGFEPEINAVLIAFVAINSETDSLPVGKERALWNKDALAQHDHDIVVAEKRWRDEAIAAATQLVKLLEQSA
ncbi:hypothetical protein [Bradyrhizobium prioriisuperbiae]|uniref:hypothetical protein n=1 Tax=Bradyrhizobium prioriisuperbiae TaxID=2854389 RepID=UPI0028EA563F|nr:hypothetical protein [Bradyrhizobium prioritasuperba]